MKIKRRRDSGAFVVPSIPKAPRSARRTSSKKKLEDDHVCPFDLLAAVAEKLLQENENSSASSNETETKDQFGMGKDAMKLEQDTACFHKKESQILDEHMSALSTSDGSQNVETDLSIGISVTADVSPKICDKTKTAHHCQGPSYDDAAGQRTEGLSKNKSVPTQFPGLHHNKRVKFVNRDDNETYINCCTKRSKDKSPPHTESSRVRKFLGYKYWNTSPKLRDHNCCAGAKNVNCGRRTYHEQDRGVENSPVKKRKLFDQSSVVTSDREFCSESFSKSDDECANMNKSSNGAKEECSSTKSHPVSGHARDSQVRLSIKSFKVPELLVEVPFTATVGSLKTTVLEAVSSVLRGGLHVEVIVGGKKLKDDTDTLIHSGISHNCNLDSLGFMLELSSPNSPSPRCQNDHLALSAVNDHKPPKRFPAIALADAEISDELSPLPSLRNEVKIDYEMVPISTDAVPEKSQEGKALALFPVTTVEPLAIAPMDQKSKRSELAQRRTRRPFSVSEVEALVQSVEELGTGRWRDVKMRSFENADHRTYVDLKDKWKTLVHTAQISPQQRRGQPVPQELLNRVLAAHAYWSQHHQIKPHTRTHFLQAP